MIEEEKTVYNFLAKDIIGEDVTLYKYRNKVLLIVNVASLCGYTSQYAKLVELHRRYRRRGLAILGFPSNDFNQEPGSEAEIKEFCTSVYDVTFDLFSKISVTGENIHPIYKFLTTGRDSVKWNFEKFLIGRNGQQSGHFISSIAPLDEKIIAAIEHELAK